MIVSTDQTNSCSRKPSGSYLGRSTTFKAVSGSSWPPGVSANTKQSSSLHRSVESYIKEDNDLELTRLLVGSCDSIRMFKHEEALGNCARIQGVISKALGLHPDPAMFIVRMLIDIGTLVFTRKLEVEFEMAISKLIVDAFSLLEEQQGVGTEEVKVTDDNTQLEHKPDFSKGEIQDSDLIDLAGMSNCGYATEGARCGNTKTGNNHFPSGRSPNLLDDDGGSEALSLMPLQPCMPSPKIYASLECNSLLLDSSDSLTVPTQATPTQPLESPGVASAKLPDLRAQAPDVNIWEDEHATHARHISQATSHYIQGRHQEMLLSEIESWKNPIPVYVAIQAFGLEAYLTDTIPKGQVGQPVLSYGQLLVLQLSKLDLWEEANSLLSRLPKTNDMALQEELLWMLIAKKKLRVLHDFVSEDIVMCEKALDFIEGTLKDRAPIYSGYERQQKRTSIAVEAEEFGCWGDIANWMVSEAEDSLLAAGTGIASRTTTCETVHLVEMALSLMMRLGIVDLTDRWPWLRFFIQYCQAVTVLETPSEGATTGQRSGNLLANEGFVLKNTWSRLPLVMDVVGDDKLLQKEIMVYFAHNKNDWLTAGYLASKYNLQKSFQALKEERDQFAGIVDPLAPLESDGHSDKSSDIASSSSEDGNEGHVDTLIDTSSFFCFPPVLGRENKQSRSCSSPNPKISTAPTSKVWSKRQDQRLPKQNLEISSRATQPAKDNIELQVSSPSSVAPENSWETERLEHAGQMRQIVCASKLVLPSLEKQVYLPTPLYSLPTKTKVVFVNRQSQLNTLKRSLHRSYVVGIDSEWLSRGRMSGRTALLKLACDFDDTTYLVDCLPCTDIKPSDLSVLLANFFVDRSVRKIAYDWDLGRTKLEGTFPLLKEKWNQPDNFLDLRYVWYHPSCKSIKSNVVDLDKVQVMEQLVTIDRWSTTPSIPEMEKTFHGGASGMLRKFFKRKLNIKLKNSNWEARPVRPEQRLYAAMTARCLLDLYSIFDKSERI